jgi:hypothetical protein
MRAKRKVTLQMEGEYPSISSGVISFKNVETGAEVRIQAPNDLKALTYGISSIVIDSGASCTVFPENFAEKIDIQRPREDEERYYIFSGVGGASIAFSSLYTIIVRIEDEKGYLEGPVYPLFLTKFALSITSEGKLLSQYRPHTVKISDFLCPPFEYQDDYTVEVRSPDEMFPPFKKTIKA